MKNVKRIHILGTAIVTGLLLTAALCALLGGGVSQNWVWGTICCCVFVAGAAGWHCKDYLRLVEGLGLIIKRLGENKTPALRKSDNKTIKLLADAIKQRFSDSATHIAELEKQVKELDINIRLSRRQKTNAEEIIYSIRDAVIVVDEFDKLLMANEAAGKNFGFDYKKSLYKSIDEVIDPAKKDFIDLLKRSRQSKIREKKHELTFPEDKEQKTYDCIISCVRDDKDKICGVVAVLHDITREKEISQMKNDFVSHVSHELKTPLASIMAYSEMLLDGEANDEESRKEFCSIIQNQAQRLNRLIEEILNISRIESGLIKVKKESVNLALLIEEQLKMIKGYADEKNIKIIEPKTKDLIVFGQVYADKDMLSQVIVNLLSNAVKYTLPGGSVRIETQIDDVGKVARVSVSDTGVGIPEEDVEKVFDKFFRVEANKNVAKGTGLGLNLVKQIIEKVHGGKVFVKSKRGEGSTFGFEIPLATTEVVETV